MEWRFSFLTESTGKPSWFPGERFIAANNFLQQSGLVEFLDDRESALVVADQVEEKGHSTEAETIREFLKADGPMQMLREPKTVSPPT